MTTQVAQAGKLTPDLHSVLLALIIDNPFPARLLGDSQCIEMMVLSTKPWLRQGIFKVPQLGFQF